MITMQKQIRITPESKATFNNNADYCVGTGRMGLAMQEEYQKQLQLAQDLAGFRYIRGHGLFCEDMSIYQTAPDGQGGWKFAGYNFTYLDRVVDSYLEKGIRPFLELGFMPGAIASGTQTIFYWKGNTTPPAKDEDWTDLVKATLRHLIERYGYEEVVTWPCEVWNEPNLPGFWENADKDKYLHLYEITAPAVKEVLPEMKVGGPAVCGGETTPGWIRDFLTFCRDKKLPLDMVTRPLYMGNSPERKGRYMYHTMRTVDSIIEEAEGTRAIIDSFPEYKGMELHITEFNTSYNPFCPIHDTNLNAVLIAGLLSRLGDTCASYSYWTFGDVFEEGGVPPRPFHGGFGMIANQLIIKPTMWTFAFFNNLKGEPVYRDDNMVVVRRHDGSYQGVAWNICQENRDAVTLNVELPLTGKHVVMQRIVDEECCNPVKVWHEMGEPASLTKEQLAFLKDAGQPLCKTQQANGENGSLSFTLELKQNALVQFTVNRAEGEPDEGYEYQWYVEHA
ncbi:MAG: xylan 1,4-beta-xylosidase [Clostridia bacterium]|nr:xylan 1,4-beta-xylosidase [Clostridia bacterium]